MSLPNQIMAHFDSGPKHRIIRIENDAIANQAKPGQQLRVDDSTLPIMRSNTKAGWVECLYLPEFHASLANTPAGDVVDLQWLNKPGFSIEEGAHSVLLVGEGLGLAPILFLSLRLEKAQKQMALLGTRDSFPFRPHPSHIVLPSLPGNVIATMPMLEERRIPCRLAHTQDAPGCYDGSVIELAQLWLENGAQERCGPARIYASGVDPSFEEQIGVLAANYALPHQFILLESSG